MTNVKGSLEYYYEDKGSINKIQSKLTFYLLDCTPVPTLFNGNILLTDSSNTTYGAAANVTCDTGYISNTTSITCVPSGYWQGANCTIIGV